MSGPPDKLIFHDLSGYTTGVERANAISTLIQNFQSTYGTYPSVILLDSVVNGVHLGAY